MKIESKIKILGWILIVWGCAGLFAKVILPVLFAPLGIGILLKNKTCAIITKYIAFFGICMSIVGVLGLFLIPRLLGGGNTAERNANLGLLVIFIMFVFLGFIFWFMYRFLKRQDVITEFSKNKIR